MGNIGIASLNYVYSLVPFIENYIQLPCETCPVALADLPDKVVPEIGSSIYTVQYILTYDL